MEGEEGLRKGQSRRSGTHGIRRHKKGAEGTVESEEGDASSGAQTLWRDSVWNAKNGSEEEQKKEEKEKKERKITDAAFTG